VPVVPLARWKLELLGKWDETEVDSVTDESADATRPLHNPPADNIMRSARVALPS